MGGGRRTPPCHAERFHAKLIHQPLRSPPTCPPSPTNGLALSTCLSANQPIRPQNEDTEEEEEQADSRCCWENPPSLLHLRPVIVRSHLLLSHRLFLPFPIMHFVGLQNVGLEKF